MNVNTYLKKTKQSVVPHKRDVGLNVISKTKEDENLVVPHKRDVGLNDSKIESKKSYLTSFLTRGMWV